MLLITIHFSIKTCKSDNPIEANPICAVVSFDVRYVTGNDFAVKSCKKAVQNSAFMEEMLTRPATDLVSTDLMSYNMKLLAKERFHGDRYLNLNVVTVCKSNCRYRLVIPGSVISFVDTLVWARA